MYFLLNFWVLHHVQDEPVQSTAGSFGASSKQIFQRIDKLNFLWIDVLKIMVPESDTWIEDVN